ncbi:hypothetical protein HKX48_003188 [Thoreauomyces humboldtii]|nr:hypothetical protein HKX48_003188 [Thoreauomyces humboldtii]
MGLCSAAFDTYSETWNSSVLANDITGETANPELANAEYKRFIDVQESKKGKALNMETAKKLTGDDLLRARRLYENGRTFAIIANIFLSVNDLPVITETDHGTWRRMRVILFNSTFVEDPALVNEDKHIYLADCEAKKQHNINAPYFMSILVHYYKRFRSEGNKTPQSVIDNTKVFRASNDIYHGFFQDCVLADEDSRIHVEELHRECLAWAATQHNNHIKVSKTEMLKWFKNYAENNENVHFKSALRVTKVVYGKRLTKVSTGFKGLRLNKYSAATEFDLNDDSE